MTTIWLLSIHWDYDESTPLCAFISEESADEALKTAQADGWTLKTANPDGWGNLPPQSEHGGFQYLLSPVELRP